MKPSAVLVNAARGPIVDEAALARRWRRGEIAAAGLDVYEHEPQVEPALLELDNVVLAPHLGSATVETRTAMAEPGRPQRDLCTERPRATDPRHVTMTR